MDDKKSKKYGESIVRLEVPESIVPLVRLLRLVAMYRYQNANDQVTNCTDFGFLSVYQALLAEVSKGVSSFLSDSIQK